MKAVSNTGPILHLLEVDAVRALRICAAIRIPPEVHKELAKRGLERQVQKIRDIRVVPLHAKSKDTAKLFCEHEYLDLGEAEAIALSIQEGINVFLTDDLEAREAAKRYGREVHGTVGILLRAYRRKLMDKKTAIQKIRDIHEKSSLFITKDLIQYIITEVERSP